MGRICDVSYERRISPSEITSLWSKAAQHAFECLLVCRLVCEVSNSDPPSPPVFRFLGPLWRTGTWWWLNLGSNKNQICTLQVLLVDSLLGATNLIPTWPPYSGSLSLCPYLPLCPSHHLHLIVTSLHLVLQAGSRSL